MKEMYLTVTDMTILLEGEVLGYGRTIAAAPGPEQPGEFTRDVREGAVRMGTFLPAGEKVPRGRWNATLEGEEGYTLTFAGERFLLSGSGEARKGQAQRGRKAAR